MRAAVFHPEQGIVLEDVANPVLQSGEVLLEIQACGVCGSDKQVVKGEPAPTGTRFPVILGHEIAGRIIALASPADDTKEAHWHIGDEVIVHPFLSCGECRQCRRGHENLCTRQELIGYHRDGGYAERIAVPTRALLRRPAGLSAPSAALLVDAFATPFHALSAVAHVGCEDNVIVMGTGGTGLAGIMLARAMGAAKVGAITRRSDAFPVAVAAGADAVWVHGDERKIGREVRRWSEGGADVVLDTLGTGESVEFGANLLQPGGQLCVIGMGTGEAKLPVSKTVRRALSVAASFGCTRKDVEGLMKLAQQGQLHPEALVAKTLPLENIGEAFQPNSLSGRTVIVPR